MEYIFQVIFILLLYGCKQYQQSKENEVFFAGPNESGFGATFFTLYDDNSYKFCDGDFFNPNCYSGIYEINGDTLILENLKVNEHVKNNRFIIYRMSEQDSTYWKNKYPKSNDWKYSRESDSLRGFQGDVYELDKNNVPITKVNYYYVIRLDKLTK